MVTLQARKNKGLKVQWNPKNQRKHSLVFEFKSIEKKNRKMALFQCVIS